MMIIIIEAKYFHNRKKIYYTYPDGNPNRSDESFGLEPWKIKPTAHDNSDDDVYPNDDLRMQ